MTAVSNTRYWWQFLFICLGYIAWTTCRIGFPVGLSAMGKQFAWTSFEIGVLSTVFLLGQALIDIPAGYWIDRLDRKNLLSGGLLGIGLFTILITVAAGFWSALIYRILFGVMEGVYNTRHSPSPDQSSQATEHLLTVLRRSSTVSETIPDQHSWEAY
jgi:MFS family permease